MSLFSWFLPKKAPAKAKPMEPTGLLNADATVPLVPGRDGRSTLEAPPPDHAANRKNERMERRELLYSVVRDAMVKAAVDKFGGLDLALNNAGVMDGVFSATPWTTPARRSWSSLPSTRPRTSISTMWCG